VVDRNDYFEHASPLIQASVRHKKVRKYLARGKLSPYHKKGNLYETSRRTATGVFTISGRLERY
jgi:hypothetical protein